MIKGLHSLVFLYIFYSYISFDKARIHAFVSINLSLTEAFAKSTQPVGYSKICQVGQQEQQIPAIYSTLGSLISQLLGKSQSQQAFATHKLASHCAN